jgi:cytidine deaminase
MSDNPKQETGPGEVGSLVEAARRVRANAYAPYSSYRVGVALRAKDGRVFTGVNVENSSFPCCLCAEHNAIGHAVSEGARAFDAIVVCSERRKSGESGSPCGRCRQVLSEFGDLWVILTGPSGDWEIMRLSALFPRAFSSEDL